MSEIKADQVIVVLVSRAGMGHAEPELQIRLMTSYLSFLLGLEPLPRAICFYADGVKLAVEGSPVLDALRELEEKGVHIILCSTCLSYFDLRDQVRVGIVGGMHDIIEAQWRADKVITL
jgi:intracellular sulfur oxidation DsrE/DsrF family protein